MCQITGAVSLVLCLSISSFFIGATNGQNFDPNWNPSWNRPVGGNQAQSMPQFTPSQFNPSWNFDQSRMSFSPQFSPQQWMNPSWGMSQYPAPPPQYNPNYWGGSPQPFPPQYFPNYQPPPPQIPSYDQYPSGRFGFPPRFPPVPGFTQPNPPIFHPDIGAQDAFLESSGFDGGASFSSSFYQVSI